MEAKRGLDVPVEVLDSLLSRRIHCKPAISIVLQRLAGRYVLRGEESGGAVDGIGAYCGYVSNEGMALPWIEQIETAASNGRHAVEVAQSFVRLHVVRQDRTCELLITRHSLGSSPARKRPTLQSEVLFRGTGVLTADLCGADNALRGRILPEFASKTRKPLVVPSQFAHAAMVACGAVCCIGCSQAHLLRHLGLVGEEWP